MLSLDGLDVVTSHNMDAFLLSLFIKARKLPPSRVRRVQSVEQRQPPIDSCCCNEELPHLSWHVRLHLPPRLKPYQSTPSQFAPGRSSGPSETHEQYEGDASIRQRSPPSKSFNASILYHPTVQLYVTFLSTCCHLTLPDTRVKLPRASKGDPCHELN
jgi:hypothetical protein